MVTTPCHQTQAEASYVSDEPLVVDDVVQHPLRLVKQPPRLRTDSRIVEDLREAAVGVTPTQLPDLEEGAPVDVLADAPQVRPAKHLK